MITGLHFQKLTQSWKVRTYGEHIQLFMPTCFYTCSKNYMARHCRSLGFPMQMIWARRNVAQNESVGNRTKQVISHALPSPLIRGICSTRIEPGKIFSKLVVISRALFQYGEVMYLDSLENLVMQWLPCISSFGCLCGQFPSSEQHWKWYPCLIYCICCSTYCILQHLKLICTWCVMQSEPFEAYIT